MRIFVVGDDSLTKQLAHDNNTTTTTSMTVVHHEDGGDHFVSAPIMITPMRYLVYANLHTRHPQLPRILQDMRDQQGQEERCHFWLCCSQI